MNKEIKDGIHWYYMAREATNILFAIDFFFLQGDGMRRPAPGPFTCLLLLLHPLAPLPLLAVGVVKDMVRFILLKLDPRLIHGPLELVLVRTARVEEDGRHGVPERVFVLHEQRANLATVLTRGQLEDVVPDIRHVRLLQQVGQAGLAAHQGVHAAGRKGCLDPAPN